MTRVAIVSTFPPAECGIGNYTRELVTALAQRSRETQVTVLAERAPGATESQDVRRVWHRRGPWVDDLLRAVDAVRPDVVHVQHEESHFGQGGAMLRFVRELQARRIAVVVTLHSVYKTLLGRTFQRRLGEAGVGLVVHQRTAMADDLERQGVSRDQIAMIAHGTPSLDLPPKHAARAALGLPREGTVALFFGFIHIGKGLHVAVPAFERAAAEHDGCLVIVGRVRRRWFGDALYAAWLRHKMRAGIAANRIFYRPGFVAAEDKAAYLAAADLLVLPHMQTYGSASGVLHEALAARRAFICSRGNKFAEAVEVMGAEIPEAFPAAGDVNGWTQGFRRMLGPAPVRERMAELVSTLADTTSWSRSADHHAAFYASTMNRCRDLGTDERAAS